MCGERTLIPCWWECKLPLCKLPLWKAVWRLLRNLETELSYDLAIPLLGLYPKESKLG
jgi:hypothetical protein